MKKREKHGLHKSPEYQAFIDMKQRCYNKKHASFKDYGGRGIGISDSWLESFVNFYNDMGPRPSKNHSIDRINNDGNYSKDNCKWSTKKEQQNNRRVTNKMLDHQKKLNKFLVNYLHEKYGNPLTRKEKTCPRCKVKKELSCFPKDKNTADKHHVYCKQCHCDYQNLRRSKCRL